MKQKLVRKKKNYDFRNTFDSNVKIGKVPRPGRSFEAEVSIKETLLLETSTY